MRGCLPKISIVTPSYNQGKYLEETITSVLDQDYPNIEYIIIDGGSTDESVSIIRKYGHKLASWVSEPDDGQADAINKGWSMATGEFLTWLNSDDTLLPGALYNAASYLLDHPDVDMVYGNCYHIDEQSERIKEQIAQEFDLLYMIGNWHNFIPQPGFLIRRQMLTRAGMLDTQLNFAMDFDYWIRVALVGRIAYWPIFVANNRVHDETKTARIKQVRAQNNIAICHKLFARSDLPKEVKQLRRRAFSSSYFVAAYCYSMSGDAQNTRHYALRSLRQHPAKWYNVSRLLLASMFGNWSMRHMRALHRKILTLVGYNL